MTSSTTSTGKGATSTLHGGAFSSLYSDKCQLSQGNNILSAMSVKENSTSSFTTMMMKRWQSSCIKSQIDLDHLLVQN